MVLIRAPTSFFADLGGLISALDVQRVIVAGDFNCHLSCSNLSSSEKLLIGRYAAHNQFNENGMQMRLFLGLYTFAVRSTQSGSNKSFKSTWSNGRGTTQIDHLLTHLNSTMYLRRLQCTSPADVSTDHRLLLCNIVEKVTSQTVSPRILPRVRKQPSRLNAAPLKHEKIRKMYLQQLGAHTEPMPDSSVEECWKSLRDKIWSCASTALKEPSPMSVNRECRKALAYVKKMLFWVNRSSHPKWRYKLAEAREQLKRVQRDYEEAEISSFFENLLQYPSGERIQRTYRYLKRYKKKKTGGAFNTTIRLNDWVTEGDDNSPSCIPSPILLPPNVAAIPGPTLAEIEQIVGRLKNGKTPGVDGLCSEFFKYSDERTLSELHALLTKVWETNVLPEEWKHVVVVPIPKTKNPKTVNEYRRICLSCTGYKVYASWILEKLQQYVGPIGLHQAAFLADRSTTDHLHVLQRILQEKWNSGTSIILMSLDLEKAFDNVSLEALPAILRGEFIMNKENVNKLCHASWGGGGCWLIRVTTHT